MDTHIFSGYEVSPYYDPLLAKVIVVGSTRDEAVRRGRRALAETVVGGLATNVDLHQAILRDQRFISGDYDLSYVSGNPMPIAESLY